MLIVTIANTMFILCAVFAVAFLLPTVLTITNSFMTESEITANYGPVFSTDKTQSYQSGFVNLKLIPDKVSFTQYINGLIRSPDYLIKFWNSVILVVPIVIFQVAIASVAAYAFTRWRGKWRAFIFFFYVILMLMPYQVTLVPNFLVSKWLGIINTRWAIVLPGIFAPFSVFLLTKYMRRIPYSLIEAAKMEGAGEWYIFTRICMPQCRAATYSIAILVFIDYWNMPKSVKNVYTDAYCAFGKTSVTGDHGSSDASVVAVGGNYFLFHPLDLVSGTYFSESDVMHDRVVLDETLAWKLFGGSNLTGMDSYWL